MELNSFDKTLNFNIRSQSQVISVQLNVLNVEMLMMKKKSILRKSERHVFSSRRVELGNDFVCLKYEIEVWVVQLSSIFRPSSSLKLLISSQT